MFIIVRHWKGYFEKLRSTITCSSALSVLHRVWSAIWFMPRSMLILVIRWYRFVLSPDHSFLARALDRPPYCKHFPSCSSYALESLQKYGVVRGWWYAIRRVLSCNPWSKWGFDPVPLHHEACKNSCIPTSPKSSRAQHISLSRSNTSHISHNHGSYDR